MHGGRGSAQLTLEAIEPACDGADRDALSVPLTEVGSVRRPSTDVDLLTFMFMRAVACSIRNSSYPSGMFQRLKLVLRSNVFRESLMGRTISTGLLLSCLFSGCNPMPERPTSKLPTSEALATSSRVADCEWKAAYRYDDEGSTVSASTNYGRLRDRTHRNATRLWPLPA